MSWIEIENKILFNTEEVICIRLIHNGCIPEDYFISIVFKNGKSEDCFVGNSRSAAREHFSELAAEFKKNLGIK